jgi:hypothetical protein
VSLVVHGAGLVLGAAGAVRDLLVLLCHGHGVRRGGGVSARALPSPGARRGAAR